MEDRVVTGNPVSPSSSIMASFDSINCLSKYTYVVVVDVIWFGWVTEKQEAD